MKPSSQSTPFALLFWLGFALLAAHEMDAMVRHEWRLLPGFAMISDDDLARDLFTLAHIPLFGTAVVDGKPSRSGRAAAHPDGG